MSSPDLQLRDAQQPRRSSATGSQLASCALRREGRAVALYFNPVRVAEVVSWLGLPADERAIILDPEPGVPYRIVPWSSLLDLTGDAELVHLSGQTTPSPGALDALPSPLLAAPALALPAELGARVALSVQGHGHGVLISGDRSLHHRALDGFLRALLAASLSGDAEPPPFGRRALAPLLEPVPADSFYTFHFQVHRRYWTLDAKREGGGVTRWVCEGPGGRWRQGWSWASATR